MSRTYKDRQNRNSREYWSSRYPKHHAEYYANPFTKHLTHKYERRQAAREIESIDFGLIYEKEINGRYIVPVPYYDYY